MQQIKHLGITLCLLITTLFAVSGCDEFERSSPFEGRWITTYYDDRGQPMEAFYDFYNEGHGVYSIYYGGTNVLKERSDFSYDIDNQYLYLYYTSGNHDTFEYQFYGANRLCLSYYDSYRNFHTEYYTRQ